MIQVSKEKFGELDKTTKRRVNDRHSTMNINQCRSQTRFPLTYFRFIEKTKTNRSIDFWRIVLLSYQQQGSTSSRCKPQ